MFSCYIHQWASLVETCPICYRNKISITAKNSSTPQIHKEPWQQKPREFCILLNSRDEIVGAEFIENGLIKNGPIAVHENQKPIYVTEVMQGYKLLSWIDICKAFNMSDGNGMIEFKKELGFGE